MAGTIYSVFKQTGIHSTTGNAHRDFLFHMWGRGNPQNKKANTKTNKNKQNKKTHCLEKKRISCVAFPSPPVKCTFGFEKKYILYIMHNK